MLHDSSSRDSYDKEQEKSNTQVEFEIGSGSIPESTFQSSLKMKSDAIVAYSPLPAPPQYFITKDRSRRDIKPPQRYAEADLVAYTLDVAKGIDYSTETSTSSEAVNCDDFGRWMMAIKEEMKSLHKNGT